MPCLAPDLSLPLTSPTKQDGRHGRLKSSSPAFSETSRSDRAQIPAVPDAFHQGLGCLTGKCHQGLVGWRLSVWRGGDGASRGFPTSYDTGGYPSELWLARRQSEAATVAPPLAPPSLRHSNAAPLLRHCNLACDMLSHPPPFHRLDQALPHHRLGID